MLHQRNRHNRVQSLHSPCALFLNFLCSSSSIPPIDRLSNRRSSLFSTSTSRTSGRGVTISFHNECFMHRLSDNDVGKSKYPSCEKFLLPTETPQPLEWASVLNICLAGLHSYPIRCLLRFISGGFNIAACASDSF
jgi:hypothetical protein